MKQNAKSIAGPHPAPTSTEAFFEQLRVLVPALPKRLRQCAEFVAANPERIAVSTVAELADGAGVQPSAFMRFCTEMGFSGFSQMQRLFREDYSQHWPDYQTRLKHLQAEGSDTPSALLAEFAEAGRLSLENLTRTMQARDLDRAVDTLAAASCIHLVGFRRAFPVAGYLAYSFEKMGVPTVLHSGLANLTFQSNLAPGHAMIAISFAPYTAETVEMVALADRAGIEAVAMTDLVTSPLLRTNALPLLVSEIDVDAFRTYTATFTLAMSLAVAVGARRTPS